MAKLYGLANYLISELTIRLLNSKEFTKFVYYKNVSDKDFEYIDNTDSNVFCIPVRFGANYTIAIDSNS